MTLKNMRANDLYLHSLILHGNNKLLDYIDDDGNAFRYSQFNTRAVIDCPCRSKGCEVVCYATKGNHVFPSVKKSRERSFVDSQRGDFADAMIYTIRTEKTSARYKNATMIIRIHESGDFYSVQYLKKWVKVWAETKNDDGVVYVFYTKSFPFFLMLTDDEKKVINDGMNSGRIAMNLSIDDTTTPEQWKAYFEMKRAFPSANTYRVTEHTTANDDVCDCANCAKCGACNASKNGHKVVVIHSASENDKKVYRANSNK